MGNHDFFTRHGNIALYVPNLIGKHSFYQVMLLALKQVENALLHATGYARIACSFVAFAVAPTKPVACIVLYFIR